MKERNERRLTYIARVNYRNAGTLFGLQRTDRRSHVYIVGKTGTGKTTLLETMLRQDFVASEGFALFDPHGDLARLLMQTIASRSADVIYINVPDPDLRWTFNPFAEIPAASRALATAGLVEVFKKMWPDDWGPRLEHLLRNVVFTLLEIPDGGFAARCWREFHSTA